MFYTFPTIFNIRDVLPAIEGRDNFIVVDKGDYKIVNYIFDDFPPVTDRNTAILRECRGIIFDGETGDVISRALHKFFNAGQKEEVLFPNIDITQPHIITSKLDGSFIRGFKTSDGTLRFGTKMGETDVAEMTKDFFANNPNYVEFIDTACDIDYTAVFEFCTRKQQIVIDYGAEDRMVLIAYRNNITGKYFTYSQMVNIAKLWNIEVVEQHGTISDVGEFVNKVADETGIEGYVLTFDNGHKTKIKCSEYLKLHRVKDTVSDERAVMGLILDGKLDDCYSFLNEADTKRLTVWESVVCHLMLNKTSDLLALHRQYLDTDRKTFALEVAPTLPGYARVIMFKVWDRDVSFATIEEMISDYIRSTLTQPAKWAQIKEDFEFPTY